MFFSSEREFKKALRDTLMRAAWYELLSTMANCGKIVTFLCLGISIITWVIILKQLFTSGLWILVNIPLDFVSGNIHQYSLRLLRIIVKYWLTQNGCLQYTWFLLSSCAGSFPEQQLVPVSSRGLRAYWCFLGVHCWGCNSQVIWENMALFWSVSNFCEPVTLNMMSLCHAHGHVTDKRKL